MNIDATTLIWIAAVFVLLSISATLRRIAKTLEKDSAHRLDYMIKDSESRAWALKRAKEYYHED